MATNPPPVVPSVTDRQLSAFSTAGIVCSLLAASGLTIAAAKATGGFLPGLLYALEASAAALYAVLFTGIKLYTCYQDKNNLLSGAGILLWSAAVFAALALGATAPEVVFPALLLAGFGVLAFSLALYLLTAKRFARTALGVRLAGAGVLAVAGCSVFILFD